MADKTVSNTTRNAVWNDFLDSAKAIRYYDTLSDHYRFRHRVVMCLLAVSAAVGVVALLDFLPKNVQMVMNAGVVVAGLWGLLSNDARKSAVLHAVSLQCSHLHDEYKALWLDIENDMKDDEETLSILKRLNAEGDRATGVVGSADISINEKINKKSTESADKVLVNQYTVSA